MSELTVNDGARIYFKDWGKGQPVVFSHGWPLTADAWDGQMLHLVQNGYRVIAHDRRGHGRSSQPSQGHTMDQYADDLAQLIEHLDLRDAVLVGHSTGGGEVTRYIGRHDTSRVAKVVLVGAVPPLLLRSDANPNGLPREIFDGIRNSAAADRAQYFKDFAMPFYGYNRPGAQVSQGICDFFWLQAMQGGIKPIYDCVEQFSATDFSEDLRKFDIPTLVIHGDDDQIVPIGISAKLSCRMIPGAQLKIYPGAPHGLTVTLQDRFNADLLEFLRSGALREAA